MINGQKVWTTTATRPLGPALGPRRPRQDEHKGLAYFLLDMQEPGVEVRPLKQMNGHASFDEVFFTDAEVSPEDTSCDGATAGRWRPRR